ncbi:c-type cytochrome [Histidinibacterium aquaticum]|uniref:C-type cytochrome n=1 Tax=Histidinibacterium aquaticum TaxID=2613962 RepID=A0A5J5GQU6_9RHOB|nr:cytochrome c [Histidinibacterium aquaticum]KAA9009944.1 c-type cytochrome [Histidinibacterium aquaticum]
MTRRVLAAGFAALALPTIALAQDGDLLGEGEQIFETNCAQCHQSDGEGLPPNFPALAGNDRLSDPSLIVQRVHYGLKSMPAFPDFGPRDLAAVASYVRTSWGNDFGTVDESQAEELLASVEPPEQVATRTIWDGVFTEDQAQGARLLYQGGCAPCHGSRLNGAPDTADMSPAPPLAGTAYMRSWNGSTVGSLFEFTRSSMPISNPGQFTDQQYIDIIAYMLSYHGAPAGDEPLPPDLDVLNDIVIEPEEE